MSRALERLRPLAALLALATASGSAWIRLTPWNSWTHALSVGAPELAPWLVTGALIAFALALVDARLSWIARGTLLLSTTGILLCTSVLASLGATRDAFDAAMTQALGPDYLASVPADATRQLRADPIDAADFFRLYEHDADTVAVDHHVPVAVDGQVSLAIDVYHAKSGARRPAVLQLYSGAWRAGEPADNDAISRALALAGFVVFAGDYRHAPAWTWPAQLHDVQATLTWIARHATDYGADPTRIVLIGRSAGAQLAFIGGVTSPSPPIAGIVGLYSPVDLTEGYRHPPVPDIIGSRSLESALIGGTPDDRADAYRAASPITYADQPHPPVLLIHGGRDVIVTPPFARLFSDHLRRSGTSIYLEIPWAGHGFDTVPFGPGGQLALYYTERFVAWATNRAGSGPGSVR